MTDDKVARVLTALQQVGTTIEEAALFAGIAARTLHRWTARGRDADAILPVNWRKRPTRKLYQYLAEYGIEARQVRGRGPGGEVTREDVVDAIEYEINRYKVFFARYESARLDAEVNTAARLRELGIGGKVGADGRMEPIVRRTTKTTTRTTRDGQTSTEIVEEVEEVGPNANALMFILSRRHPGRWAPPKSTEPKDYDPRTKAKEIAAHLRQMRESVPTEPAEGE